MLPSIDAPMLRPPLYGVDYYAGARISAENRARNKQATAEFEASLEHIAESLRAWELALRRSTEFLDAFHEVK